MDRDSPGIIRSCVTGPCPVTDLGILLDLVRALKVHDGEDVDVLRNPDRNPTRPVPIENIKLLNGTKNFL